MQNRLKFTALAFAIAFIFAGVMVPGPAAAGIVSLELVPGKYTGTSTYVPGEVMSIVITGDVENEEFTVFSVMGEEATIGDITIPSSGSIKVSYEVPNVPDGDYLIRVKRTNGAIEKEAPFTVQGYVFKIETDRNAYLSGDEIRVFWTANNIKDQTLPSSGIGKIEVWSQNPTNPDIVERILEAHRFNISAGSVSFKLPPIVNYSMRYYVDGWFNSSAVSPLRIQYSKAVFSIKRLGVLISMDKDQYTAGSLMRLTVRTFATDNPANPASQDAAEPMCNVTISIKKQAMIQPTYGPITLKTDSGGILKHIIALLDEAYAEGTVFELEIRAYKGINSISDSNTFEIVSSSSISIVLNFNRAQYASGETLFVNATASAIGETTSASFTYIQEIRATLANGSLLARDTQLHGNFSFSIPGNFEGLLWVKVTADDGAGNSASVIQQVSVTYALILVNANKDYYNPKDRIDVTYSIIGNMNSVPEIFYYYIVYDNDDNVVEEGVTSSGRFDFLIPDAPSSKYVFTVFASAGGRVVEGTDQVYLFSGYLLNLEFSREFYGPGDIIAVNYHIIEMGNSNMPASFLITYGLVNGPVSSLQTTDTSGTLLYTVPDDIDQGDQLFMAVCNFGTNVQASASEVLLIKSGANPLWHLRISDIPIFNIALLLLVLLSLYMAYRTRKRMKALETDGIYKKAPAGDGILSKRTQEPQSHVMECVECGNPIEITTSRRPIEVMCPHCGEIQLIE
ncbi:MAG: hypothetical protein R6W91_01670 [Thermoplasmata archaeon]